MGRVRDREVETAAGPALDPDPEAVEQVGVEAGTVVRPDVPARADPVRPVRRAGDPTDALVVTAVRTTVAGRVVVPGVTGGAAVAAPTVLVVGVPAAVAAAAVRAATSSLPSGVRTRDR